MANMIYGKNPIREASKAKHIKTLYISRRLKDDNYAKSISKDIKNIKYVSDDELTRLCGEKNHQGYVADVKPYGTTSLETLISESKKSSKYPLLLMLDGIEDPHNLGAILRSADAFGVDGIIVKSRGNAPFNGTVAKVSTGAIEYVPVAVVPNLSQAIKKCQDNGFWVVATDGEGTMTYDKVDYKSPIVLIVGSEGFGISKLVLKNSDFVVQIPMKGHVNSLNASNAACLMLAHIDLARNL